MAADPNRRPHGRVVRGSGSYTAFVPAPLPPPVSWDGELVAALSKADRAVGRLAGEGWRLPNPEIFVLPFLRREALAGVQSGRPVEVLRLFIGNPFWTASGIAEELGVAYTTARRAIERLEVAGIVSQTGTSRRNRVYCAREMLEVLEAPQAAGRSGTKGDATLRAVK